MIRTRFAPSPTGALHIGGVRTALFSWLHARKNGGKFVLRIEDTDQERSTQESVDAILEGMEWLGLDWDEGPFYQSKRFDVYDKYIKEMVDEGKAYRCYCSKERLTALREDQMEKKLKPRYDGHCWQRTEPPPEDVKPVIRFRNPQDGSVAFEDEVRGRIVFSNDELDDLIIARPDGTPTYNFTVVIDDMLMGISHVVRGDDHVNNTPRQINILAALGATPPQYAHVPMILGDDGQRLSKRHGAVSVLQYREDGFLPEAVLNYLVRLGWSHGDQEAFTVDEMIQLFELNSVNKAPSTFNTEKLEWLNQQYIKAADPDRLVELLKPFMSKLVISLDGGPNLRDVVVAQQERAMTLKEMADISAFFYQDFEEFDEKSAKKNLRPVALEGLQESRVQFAALTDWTPETVHQVVKDVAEKLELKMGKVAQPLRVAVVGRAASPGIDVTLHLVGQKACLRRIDSAIEFVQKRAEEA